MGFTEFLSTNVNRDGTLQGPDLEWMQQISQIETANVIASGGISNVEDVAKASLLSLENHPSEYYIIGTGLGTNVNDIYGKLKELTHYNGKAIYETERKGEV